MTGGKTIVAACSFSLLLLVCSMPSSHAELWDLLVDLSVDENEIIHGNIMTVNGSVVDHAYKPVDGAEILIRTGSDTIRTVTDQNGEFQGKFESLKRIHGTYTVNVVASLNGMTGLQSTSFDVKGDTSHVAALQEKISTDEARKYLSAEKEDFERDPIGMTLFRHYHGLLEQLIQEKKEAAQPTEKELFIEKQREAARILTEQAIGKYNPGYGTYSGYKYDYYIGSLDSDLRDIVTSQLNYTKKLFSDAQTLRDSILAKGGTFEDARKAYLDSIAVPKGILENLNREMPNDGNSTRHADNG